MTVLAKWTKARERRAYVSQREHIRRKYLLFADAALYQVVLIVRGIVAAPPSIFRRQGAPLRPAAAYLVGRFDEPALPRAVLSCCNRPYSRSNWPSRENGSTLPHPDRVVLAPEERLPLILVNGTE